MTHPLVAAARSYLGVKFRHRGRSRYSLDCAGLGVLAYRDCGVDLPDVKLYGRVPSEDKQELPLRIAESLGVEPALTEPVRLSDLQVGDVLLIRYDLYPHHVMIVGDAPYVGALTVIHADGHHGEVIEHRLDEKIAGRATHVFRRPV